MSVEVVVRGDDIKDVVNAITRFNRLVKKSEILEEVWNRQEYLKPSKKKKLKRERAVIKRKRQEKVEAKKNRNLNNI